MWMSAYPLAQVFVDLPIIDEPQGVDDFDVEEDADFDFGDHTQDSSDRGFIKAMLAVSSERLDPKSLASGTIGQRPRPRDSTPMRGRFVLVGGPGPRQDDRRTVHLPDIRASIISRRPQELLSAETRRALSLINEHCKEEGIDLFYRSAVSF